MANDSFFGVGLNNFALMAGPRFKYGAHYTLGLEQDEKVEGQIYRAPVHNIYLLVAAETGWLSMLLFIIAMLYFVALALRAYLRARTPLSLAVSAAAASTFIAVMAHGLLEYQLRVTNIWYAFFILAGMTAALQRRRRAKARGAGKKVASTSVRATTR